MTTDTTERPEPVEELRLALDGIDTGITLKREAGSNHLWRVHRGRCKLTAPANLISTLHQARWAADEDRKAGIASEAA